MPFVLLLRAGETRNSTLRGERGGRVRSFFFFSSFLNSFLLSGVFFYLAERFVRNIKKKRFRGFGVRMKVFSWFDRSINCQVEESDIVF